MTFLTHLIKDGERWDAIAFRYYGDVTMMADLIAANPALPIAEFLPSGQQIIIPIIDTAPDRAEDLPPWK